MRLQQARPMTPEELRSTGSKPDVSEGAEAPDDFEEMLAGLDRIIHDKELQQQLIDAGLLIRAAPPSAPDPEPEVRLLKTTFREDAHYTFKFNHEHKDGTRVAHDITDLCDELRVLPPLAAPDPEG